MLCIGYVEEIYQVVVGMTKGDLQKAQKSLDSLVPSPMNTMLEKHNKDEAIKKRSERSQMSNADVPPTTGITK